MFVACLLLHINSCSLGRFASQQYKPCLLRLVVVEKALANMFGAFYYTLDLALGVFTKLYYMTEVSAKFNPSKSRYHT